MAGKHKGNSNKITREYLDSLLTETRYIGSTVPDTSLVLYGETFATPIMTAAFSHLKNNGMVELAKGAKAAGAVMWAGMGDEDELKAMLATGARVIKIIKPYADESLIFEQIEEAEKHGALAVGMDIDHSFDNTGQFDNVLGSPMHAKSIEDLKKYVQATSLPFIIKGVLSTRDTQTCIEAGVRGIVVSHHSGITDYAIPPLAILPEIAELVADKFPIFVDCGIERGFDAFKAIALGATAVCVGRTILADLEDSGNQGACDKIEAMTKELAGAMARTSSATLGAIDSSIIRTLTK